MAWTTGILGVWTGDLKTHPECLLWVGIGPLHIVHCQVIKLWSENHRRAGERIRVHFILKIKNFCTSRFYTHTHTHIIPTIHIWLFLFLIPKANQPAHLVDSELDYLSHHWGSASYISRPSIHSCHLQNISPPCNQECWIFFPKHQSQDGKWLLSPLE